jgi:hypothetical protein
MLKLSLRQRATMTSRLLVGALVCSLLVAAQTPKPTPSVAPHEVETEPANDLVAHAIDAVCTEREQDPLGSAAIDEMQARPSLPLLHTDVVAGVARAERLLPLAKTLSTRALRTLARAHSVSFVTLRPALARLAEVKHIKPDVELRDNASVFYQDPQTIRFGTLFLAGLRSDEGMMSVLAHELTHVADGPHSALALLFRRVALQASRAAQLRITGHRAEELSCDLMGALVARAYIARTPSVEPPVRRAARAIEHNCVTRDMTDTAHLSPRRTMRALLALDPAFARQLTGAMALANAQPPTRRIPRTRHVAAHATPR